MNKFVLNREKTKIILFRTPQARIETPEIISLANEQRKLVKHTKFLGIHVDEHLNWEIHIENLCLKINKICYSLRVISKYLNQSSVKVIYFANFESAIRYGIIFWGSNSSIQNIFIIQKRAIRIIQKMKFNDTCRGVFKNMKIMTVYAVYIYECLLFLFKNKGMFTLNNTMHNYSTRNLDITYPRHSNVLTEHGAYYMCIRLYNKLPNRLKETENLIYFKNQIKKFLIEMEPYSLNEHFNYRHI